MKTRHSFRNLESPLLGYRHIFEMGIRRKTIGKEIIEASIEMTTRHFTRILRLQCSGCGIARVGEKRLFIIRTLGIQFFKHLPRHKDFSANLKLLRPVARQELQRDAADGFHICGDIIPLCSVAASYGTNHSSVAIGDGDRGSVKFHLSRDREILAIYCFSDTVEPFVNLLDGICVG